MKMVRQFSLPIIIACASLLGACTGTVEKFSDGKPQVVAAPDTVSAMLADAADRAASALENLSAIEHSRSPGVAVAPITNPPTDLRRAITVSWTGPVEPITKSLAERASYTFVTVGQPPPVPIIVSLNVENKPVIEALRDIGLQLGVRADVRVDSSRRIVEIYYQPVTGLGQEF